MKKTGVLGAGTMGAGIIQVMAQSGYEVTFIEQKQEFVDRGIEKIIRRTGKGCQEKGG